MKTTENYLEEIKEIRKIMEQSGRFLSLSGLSGILIGLYALAGAFVAYLKISKGFDSTNVLPLINWLSVLAFAVLVLSIITTLWLTSRKARKEGKKIWNYGSRQMLINLAIPFISGGILILIFTFRGFYEIISPACLVFYGLALINAAKFTRQEIFYLGLLQIISGIFAAFFPDLGLFFWALGFGVLHIIYGALMYFRYEHNAK